jgi:hypothetical protein
LHHVRPRRARMAWVGRTVERRKTATEAGSRNIQRRRASLGGWWTPNDARFTETIQGKARGRPSGKSNLRVVFLKVAIRRTTIIGCPRTSTSNHPQGVRLRVRCDAERLVLTGLACHPRCRAEPFGFLTLTQLSQSQERRLFFLDHSSVHGDGSRDYSVNQIGFGKFLTVNKYQWKVKESIFEVVECLKEMTCRVIDGFILVPHLFFSSEIYARTRPEALHSRTG